MVYSDTFLVRFIFVFGHRFATVNSFLKVSDTGLSIVPMLLLVVAHCSFTEVSAIVFQGLSSDRWVVPVI